MSLARQPSPAEAVREYLSQTPQCRLAFIEWLTTPGRDSPCLNEIDLREDGYGPRHDRYYGLQESAEPHYLLGRPRPIQNDVLGSADRRHLLSPASDDIPGWCWGDGGTLYFTLPTFSLAAGRLADGVRFEMQCG